MISSDSMSLPFVSIIIPAYQSSGTLSHTLESVILQEYSNFEVIVINDGSTDTTLDIIDHYSKLDHRVRCINLKSNSGPAIARNIGVENSHGTLIAFLDADDQWHSCKLKHQVEFMQQSPSTDLVFTDCLNINIDPVTSVREEVRLFSINNNFFKDINLMPVLKSDKFFALNGPIRRSLYSKCFILPSTVILRRSSFDRSGGFNPNRFGTEDIDLWIRLASFGEFVCWNKPTVYRSVTGLGISAMSEKWLLELLDYHHMCLNSGEYTDLHDIAIRNLEKSYRHLIIFYGQNGQTRKVFETLRTSLFLGFKPRLTLYALLSMFGRFPFTMGPRLLNYLRRADS